jgi:hypothetical protein
MTANWTSQDVYAHMKVYTADGEAIGHVAEVYEDSFLVHKGYFFPRDRYFPYGALSHVEENRLDLSLTVSEAQEMRWEKRPNYEDHLGDPTQLFYDRGHNVHDPFDEVRPGNS